MTTFGIAMVKDEADIIVPVLRHMLTQVDHIIVADNNSTDDTRTFLELFCDDYDNVEVLDDPEVGYYQSRKMSALAAMAADQGAEWVVPFDADEVWLSRDGRPIRNVLRDLPATILKADADVWDHVATGTDDMSVPDPIDRIRWRRSYALPLPKVACRAVDGLVIHQGNHGARFPGHGDFAPTIGNALTVRHFPYRSPEQFIEKVRQGAAAYKATDLPESMGAHWRKWGQILENQGEQAITDLYHKWYFRRFPSEPVYIEGEFQPPLVHDPVRC